MKELLNDAKPTVVRQCLGALVVNEQLYIYINLAEIPSIMDEAGAWFHSKWGVPKEAYLEYMEDFFKGKTDYDC